MPEIKLKKRYPHIPIEDVTQIFNEGYLKGYENGLKTAIPIGWLLEQSRKLPLTSEKGMYIDEILEDWKAENEANID